MRRRVPRLWFFVFCGPANLKTTRRGKKGSTMNSLIQLKQTRSLFIAVLELACFGLMPRVQAVVPPPDGCYPNFTTAEGCDALNFLTTGAGNTGLGWRSLFLDSTGSFNTGVGGGALALNDGDSNTAVGAGAILLNTSGERNTAVGTNAMVNNDTGNANTVVGAFALFSNVDGGANNAFGYNALFNHQTGDFNNAFGGFALYADESGGFNSAFGYGALNNNVSGNNNTAIGYGALSESTGNNNTALGFFAGVNLAMGAGNVYIGANMFGAAGESNHTYIRNIKDTTVSGGGSDTVTVNLTTGLLGHAASSRRYKEDIRPMEEASETLYRLKPVTYRYKKEVDRTQSPAFGLIAEEVAEVDPNLVARNAHGQPESVHYEMVNAMLLNEFLKEHRRNEEQQATIARLEKQVAALTAGLQKVSAQLAAVSPSLADLN
jgi:hypothetical protein